MRKKPSTSLAQARERAAGELGLPVDDWRVERLAKLVIADEAMQSLLIVAPERVDYGKLLDIDRALAGLRKELGATKPMNLNVHIVETSDVVACPKCSHEFAPAVVYRTLEESQRAAREREATEKAVPKSTPGTVDLVAGATSIRDGATMADHAKMHGPNVTPITAADRRAKALAEAPLKKHQPNEWDAYRAQIPTV
jgi:hypothetical protein